MKADLLTEQDRIVDYLVKNFQDPEWLGFTLNGFNLITWSAN